MNHKGRDSPKLTNMEQQSQVVLKQGELDFESPAPWACPPAEDRGASPRKAAGGERQVFEAWKEELDPGDRLLEAIASRWVFEAAYHRVRGNKAADGCKAAWPTLQGLPAG